MRDAFYNLNNFLNTTDIDDVYWNAAKNILSNINLVPGSTITEVAEFSFVSTATISRLCRKLGYESFSEFKKNITDNLQYFNQDAKRLIYDYQLTNIQDAIDNKDILSIQFKNIISNLNETYNSVNFDDLDFLVDKLHDAKRICFIGNSFTQSICQQLQVELSSKGKDCMAMFTRDQQKIILDTLDEDDIVILSSIAGGFITGNPDIIHTFTRTPAYKVVITQVRDFPGIEYMDKIINVGNATHSLIGKFSITYIFEVLETLYHLKYGLNK